MSIPIVLEFGSIPFARIYDVIDGLEEFIEDLLTLSESNNNYSPETPLDIVINEDLQRRRVEEGEVQRAIDISFDGPPTISVPRPLVVSDADIEETGDCQICLTNNVNKHCSTCKGELCTHCYIAVNNKCPFCRCELEIEEVPEVQFELKFTRKSAVLTFPLENSNKKKRFIFKLERSGTRFYDGNRYDYDHVSKTIRYC